MSRRRPFKILVVGSNPAQRGGGWGRGSHARSWMKLSRWLAMADLTLDELEFANASPWTTKGNRAPLEREKDLRSLQRASVHAAGVVGMGEVARRTLERIELPHLSMPHPSGLNLKLNDKGFEAAEVEKLRLYVATCRALHSKKVGAS